MRASRQKDVLTTGQVARICHVAPRTVSKWFDTGKLPGYRIPGSRDRRIPLEKLIQFMRDHDMPLDGLDGGACRILIIQRDVPADLPAVLAQCAQCQVLTAANRFEAGVLAQRLRPHAVVLDVDGRCDEAVAICRQIKGSETFGGAVVIAAADHVTDALARRLLDEGFDGVLPKPYTPAQLMRAVENATNVVW
jgi:excisionase family DNA binding protein